MDGLVKPPAILAIDQGTSSSRTLAFTVEGDILHTAQKSFAQIYPKDGWVEHDPEAIWTTTLQTLRKAYRSVSKTHKVAAIGITNQRETTLIWERATGQVIYNAIVWQDRRTAAKCEALKKSHKEADLTAKTGLLFDPYFSATKVSWILDNVPGARARAKAGELCFGTVDSFLIFRLTGGRSHMTDATNASRTNLYNIHTGSWDDELLKIFNVPRAILPEVKNCADDFGQLDQSIVKASIPILGVAGDQQSAAIGQSCFKPGDIKSTYGTGCFVLVNTGRKCLTSQHRLLSTVAYQLAGRRTYALEGSIFIAGAAIQWLRDEMQLINNVNEIEALVRDAPPQDDLYFVPAFTGLGAPYWVPNARGAVFGMTRDTSRGRFMRAVLESIGYQTQDLIAAMAQDGVTPSRIKVDGGMVRNDWFVQELANILNLTVDRPHIMETTALGAAFLAALQAGFYKNFDELSKAWSLERRFKPVRDDKARAARLKGWRKAVDAVLAYSGDTPNAAPKG